MKRISIFTLILTLAVTACQEGIIEKDALLFDSEIRFNISTPEAQTKVADGAFEANDKIGLYVTDYMSDNLPMPLQLSGNRANNMTVSYDGANWTPQQSIYWGTGKSDVYAYYPYSSEISDVNNQYFELALDQTGEGYESSDFLWAKAAGVKQTDGVVNLAMKHVMSKIVVKIVAGEDYIGSLPEDASVLLHSTVTAGRIDLEKGAVSKDPYSGAKSIQLRNLGLQTLNNVKMVVYEAIVIPQMLENSVPLFEINSKSVSYLLEDTFNFRPGTSYTYTVTLNTSTNAIKVEIGCDIEDWNNAGSGGSGDSGNGDNGSEDGNDDINLSEYTDLSAPGTANCYLINEAGKYRFKAVQGNTDGIAGNIKSVEVLWESFGTAVMPNVGDIITDIKYSNGYICFSTPEDFKEGNAVIAAKSSKGMVLWSWHMWCAKEKWDERAYPNNAGILMDRNLGAFSATPGDVGALGLLYQWGRKDPFPGSASISEDIISAATGTWTTSELKDITSTEMNPMVLSTNLSNFPDNAWSSTKTAYDPCPYGWRVPNGEYDGPWYIAGFKFTGFDEVNKGISLDLGNGTSTWYPAIGSRYQAVISDVGKSASYWTSTSDSNARYLFGFYRSGISLWGYSSKSIAAYGIRCQKETANNNSSKTSGNEGVDVNNGNGVWEPVK